VVSYGRSTSRTGRAPDSALGVFVSDEAEIWIQYDPTELADAGFLPTDLTVYYIPYPDSIAVPVAFTLDTKLNQVQATVPRSGILAVWAGDLVPADVPEAQSSGDGKAVAHSLQVRPNPMKWRAQVSFHLEAAENVRAEIVDAAGRRARTLVNSGRLQPGRHEFRWDGNMDDGRPAAPGVYFAHVRSRDRSISRKLVVIR